MPDVAAILEHIDDRLSMLREELAEARQSGVNTPGFNQTLGAIDELRMLVEFLNEGG